MPFASIVQRAFSSVLRKEEARAVNEGLTKRADEKKAREPIYEDEKKMREVDVKRFLLCITALVAFSTCVMGHVLSASAEDVIKVGIVDTYTGPATTYTEDVLDGFKLAINQVNAKGGVLGRKIVFLVRDDKFKPDIALEMTKDLVMRENVDLIIGSTNSGAALGMSDFARKEKVPFIVTDAKSDKITGEKGHRYVFNTNENTAMIGRATALMLSKKPYVKYWIMGEDYEFGHACADGIWNNLKAI